MPDDENKNEDDASRRGFAAMDPDEQRRIASEGGKAAHRKGTAHEWDSEEAREAGRRGGKASHSSSEEMSEGEAESSGDNEMGDEDEM